MGAGNAKTRTFSYADAEALRARGMTYKEIAMVMGISKSAVGYALSSQRRQEHIARVTERRKQDPAWYAEYYERRGRKRAQERRRENRLHVVDHYGGRCECCGESEEAFLAVDHINGGGYQHRKSIGGGSDGLYSWLIRNNFPPGFQMLCHNCNFAESHRGGCPHKRIPSLLPSERGA